MSKPDIATIASSNTEWWLRVHNHDGVTYTFGPYKKASECKWLEDHIRRNADKYGWDRALSIGDSDNEVVEAAEAKVGHD